MTSNSAPPELTDSQQALIEKIAGQVTKDTAPGIAKQAIEDWRSGRARLFRPKTWTKHDHYIVEVLSVVFCLLAILALVITVDDISQKVHDKIRTKTFIDNWSRKPEFVNSTSDAITSIAKRPKDANPVLTLLRTSLAQNPLMVFQGEETFAKGNALRTVNEGCFAITTFLAQIKPAKLKDLAIDPDVIELPDSTVCELQINLSAPSTLNVPFFANLGHYNASEDDDVRLVVGVARHRLEAAELTDNSDAKGRSRSNSKLAGLEIVLHTKIGDASEAAETEEIAILHKAQGGLPGLNSMGNGYWEIALNDIVKRPVQRSPITEQMFHKHHAISVSLKEKAFENGAIALNERVNVRVFVFVNTLRKVQ